MTTTAPAPGTAHLRVFGTGGVVCVTDPEALPAARAAVLAVVTAVDAACSRFRLDSELQRVNASAGRQVPVSPLLAQFIGVALEAARHTDGLVDPTVGGAMRGIGYDRTFRRIGRDVRVRGSAFAPVPGWRTVQLDAGRGTVRTPPGTVLDLGATAKAFAADRAAAAAHSTTGEGVLVSLGGDIAVAGTPPHGGWPVRIAEDHAVAPDRQGPVVALTHGGLATSSTTIRRWRAGGVEVHHLIDPRTGASAGSVHRTVSVTAPRCVDANIAASACIVMGADAPAWLHRHGLAARLVAAGGAILTVGGWPEDPR